MQSLLVDFLPIVLFFITYKFYGLYVATGVCIGAAVLQIGYTFFQKGKVETTQCIALLAILVLGGATLWFKNELFIKWKPTVVYWIFATLFMFSQQFFNTPLIKKILKSHASMDEVCWSRLNTYCGLFFSVMGGLNIWVAYHFNTDTWVNFKLFGTLGLTLLFSISLAAYVSRYAKASSLS